ncbi:hypothetical protein U724_23905 [Pseudomonas chlororaphis subsp. aurantiaca PB-St2]|nr:hypothetical protein U724_23905 [Pseudomonas chlororaphis subsp. aurantiaca PB-St2]
MQQPNSFFITSFIPRQPLFNDPGPISHPLQMMDYMRYTRMVSERVNNFTKKRDIMGQNYHLPKIGLLHKPFRDPPPSNMIQRGNRIIKNNSASMIREF